MALYIFPRENMKTFLIMTVMLSLWSCGNPDKNNSSANDLNTDQETDSIQNSRPAHTTVKEKRVREVYPEPIDEESMQRAEISKTDSTIHVYNNIRADYRVFGYSKPDTTSQKMFLISVFTNDVKDNPNKCLYGSYYDSASMSDISIKYLADAGAFVKANLYRDDILLAPVYLERKWVEFEE
ncbi:hypothetical protein HMPREF0765_0510 [Sphingobacterium spiritivorum ATCC 33300]|uniref:Uncharacterized protein n=1 Tax=Sphingobacterium spiritivorum ATCC 33300 TaxID=525372 RepID=C2FT54_SPHSI|nr:hypothetical protein [Sphingobacterium spiritivorum]EEI93888.1 hypothetical protein HMPREF0765_0510 [Sphingobacterium spiritivorum ATCC 33300]QQS94449.1 hypothetical protein I6J03_13705 [Sphingobacterium spiritivorum]